MDRLINVSKTVFTLLGIITGCSIFLVLMVSGMPELPVWLGYLGFHFAWAALVVFLGAYMVYAITGLVIIFLDNTTTTQNHE